MALRPLACYQIGGPRVFTAGPWSVLPCKFGSPTSLIRAAAIPRDRGSSRRQSPPTPLTTSRRRSRFPRRHACAWQNRHPQRPMDESCSRKAQSCPPEAEYGKAAGHAAAPTLARFSRGREKRPTVATACRAEQ